LRTFLAGDCHIDNIFKLVDPTRFSEIEFEAEVHKALNCLMPNYWCRVFSGSFKHEGERRMSDLVMIHRDLSHWFVVEVEIAGHSLERHVLPQVRCLRFGDPTDTCITSLMNAFPEFPEKKAQEILNHVPRSVMVIANIHDPVWFHALRGLDAEYLVVSVYEGTKGRRAYEIEGRVSVRKESMGFAQFSSTYNSIKTAKSCQIPLGTIQIEDQFGNIGDWTVTEAPEALWLTKNHGPALLRHNELVQLVRNIDGRISLKQSSGS
jgi:hypothetical protein